MNEFRILTTVSLADIDNIQRPEEHEGVDLQSSAFEVFTDFTTAQPFMLEQSVSISQAALMLQREHVRRKLVIDSNERFLGVVSLSDLLSTKVMRAMESTGMKREDMTIADVMIKKENLQAIDFTEFQHAKIGDILMIMRQFGEEHVLVVESKTRSIRGIVSSTDIARKLHKSVNIDERANSFSEIYKTMRA
jgi:CBS domain-containing protein